MLQLWLYDGTPILVEKESDIPEESTSLQPPDGLYEPRKFDPEKKEWTGGENKIEDLEQPQA